MAHTIETRATAYAKVKARRKEWLDINGPCVQCGSQVELQVDHINPSTKVSHKVWSWSEERRLEELAKCQVLCRKCHEAKTSRENSKASPCDGVNTTNYYKNKCRCDPCKRAASLKKSANRQRRLKLGLHRDGTS